MSEEDIVLYAQLSDGTTVVGESNIPHEVVKRGTPIDKIWIEPKDAKTYGVVIERIKSADMIVLGPGSLYTSIIPNLLVQEVVHAINASSAPVFYVANIMTQPGETDGYSTVDHLKALYKFTELKHVDYLVANTGTIDTETVARYKRESAELVNFSTHEVSFLEDNGVLLIAEDFIEVKKGYIRHNASKISKTMIQYVEKIYPVKL